MSDPSDVDSQGVRFGNSRAPLAPPRTWAKGTSDVPYIKLEDELNPDVKPTLPEHPHALKRNASSMRSPLKKVGTVRDMEKAAARERALTIQREEDGPPETIPADDWEQYAGTAGIVFPKQQWKLVWDFVLLAAIVYSCITVPFRLGMSEPATGEWWLFELCITFFFISDLCITFNVAAADGDELILDKKRIRDDYLKFWFWIDASSSFPVEIVELAAKWHGGSEKDAARLGFLKMLRGLRLLRLLRLLKVFKLKMYMQIVEERLRFNMQYLQLVKMVAGILYLMHLFGCGWFYLHLVEYESARRNGHEPHSWLTEYDDGAAVDADVWVQYLDSIYWALMTLTTVGYGDIIPVNDRERMYTLLCLLVGAIVFGFLLSTLGSLLSNVDPTAVLIEEKLREVKEYLRWHGVPLELSLSVNRYFEYYYKRRTTADEEALLSALTPSLQREVITHLLGKTVSRIPLFSSPKHSYVTLDFQLKVHPMLRPLVREAKEVIIPKGHRDGSLYFLTRGVVVASGDLKMNFFSLEALGACFGEQSMMNESSSFNYTSKIRSELFTISSKELSSLASNFTDQGRSELAELLLGEFFKHSISRNVALRLYTSGMTHGRMSENAMALRLQAGYHALMLSRLTGDDSPEPQELVPLVFGGSTISWRMRAASAHSTHAALFSSESQEDTISESFRAMRASASSKRLDVYVRKSKDSSLPSTLPMPTPRPSSPDECSGTTNGGVTPRLATALSMMQRMLTKQEEMQKKAQEQARLRNASADLAAAKLAELTASVDEKLSAMAGLEAKLEKVLSHLERKGRTVYL